MIAQRKTAVHKSLSLATNLMPGESRGNFFVVRRCEFYFILFKFSSANIIPLMLVGYKMVVQCSQLGFSALSTLEHPRAVSREGRPHKMIGAGRVILVPIRVFNLKTSTAGDFAVPFTVLRSKKKLILSAPMRQMNRQKGYCIPLPGSGGQPGTNT